MRYLVIAITFIYGITQAHAHGVFFSPRDPHGDHPYQVQINGHTLAINAERWSHFIEHLAQVQIAVVSVKGMVCDFCARGIEKVFKKDKSVIKIDVDLDKGKVLVAYHLEKKIDLQDIKNKIRSNGQSPVAVHIVII